MKRACHYASTMSKAEIILIMILFHESGCCCLKHFYQERSVGICASLSKGCSYNNLFVGQEVEITIPLSGFEYQSDAENWRVVQRGVSPDMSMAKKVALQNARQELAATIRVQVRAVIDNYGKNTAVTDNIDVVNMYEEQAYSVIDQTLAGAELVGEKLYKLENGNYRYHVCLQVNKQYLADQLSKAFESEAVLQAKFDKAQFKKVYDEQMNAFLESQK